MLFWEDLWATDLNMLVLVADTHPGWRGRKAAGLCYGEKDAKRTGWFLVTRRGDPRRIFKYEGVGVGSHLMERGKKFFPRSFRNRRDAVPIKPSVSLRSRVACNSLHFSIYTRGFDTGLTLSSSRHLASFFCPEEFQTNPHSSGLAYTPGRG